MKSMKRFQQFPDEASRIGHILFWLFPYEQDTFRRKARAHRATREGAYVRAYQGVRQISRVGSDEVTRREWVR